MVHVRELNSKKSLVEKKDFLLSLPISVQGRVLLRLSKNLQLELLNSFSYSHVLDVLNHLDPDDATDLLQVIPEHKRKKLLGDLQENIRNKVEFLLRFSPESAAGLMNLNYILVNINDTFSKVLGWVKKHESRTGKFPIILVEDNGKVIGELIGHSLALHSSKQKIGSIKLRRVKTILFNADEQQILHEFSEDSHSKVVVLDVDNSVLGIVYSEDVLRLLHKKQTKSLYSFAGLEQEENVYDSINSKVKRRYRWLIVSLLASFLVAATIAPFEAVIARNVLLAIYLPIVAMIGGNAATQTLAVVVRGFALNQISRDNAKKIIFREVSAGLINGLIVGCLVGLITFLFNQNPVFGLIIGLAMIINLALAGLFGALMPLMLKKLGKDPATSATIFITTATDICGFFFFLGLAALLL